MVDKQKKIWLDGEFIDWDEAKVHVLTHSLHYGLAAFDGMRAYQRSDGGTYVFRLREHVDRLFDSCKMCLLQPKFTREQIEQRLPRDAPRSTAWSTATSGRWSSSARAPWASTCRRTPIRTAVIAWRWGAYLGDEALKNGIRAKIGSFARHHINVSLSKAKMNGQYTNSVLAKREAKLGGYDEAILLDANGYVSEGSGENIFIVRRGVLYTPDLSCSILEGVTRDTVITLAREMGIPRRRVPPHARPALAGRRGVSHRHRGGDHAGARGRQPRRSATGTVGPITKQIQARFFDVVRGSDASHPEWLTRVVSVGTAGGSSGPRDAPGPSSLRSISLALWRRPAQAACAQSAPLPSRAVPIAHGRGDVRRTTTRPPCPAIARGAWRSRCRSPTAGLAHRRSLAPELVATHAPTRSRLVVAVFCGERAGGPDAVRRPGASAQARARRRAALRRPSRTRSRSPRARSTPASRSRCEPGSGPARSLGGHVMAFGGFLRKCYVFVYSTEVDGAADEAVAVVAPGASSARASSAAWSWSRSTQSPREPGVWSEACAGPLTMRLIAICVMALVFGFVGSMPLAGPIAILAVARATRGRYGEALRVGLGAAVAEGIYAGIAFWGFTTFLARHAIVVPDLPRRDGDRARRRSARASCSGGPRRTGDVRGEQGRERRSWGSRSRRSTRRFSSRGARRSRSSTRRGSSEPPAIFAIPFGALRGRRDRRVVRHASRRSSRGTAASCRRPR